MTAESAHVNASRSDGDLTAAIDLSVVVVTYNSSRCIDACLRSVTEQLPGAPVIVVDNASIDDTLERAARSRPDGRLVRLSANTGYGRAVNAGVATADTPSVLVLNPDVRLTAVDTAELVAALRRRPLGILVPAHLCERGLERPAFRRLEPWPLLVARELLWGRVIPPAPRSPHATGPSWVSGAVMILDQAELDALSGFDERFFLYYEDQDISRRYAAAGLPVATTDAIRATHDVGGSTSADRTVPHAWAFLALVQYVWIWNGERAGRASALGVVWGIRAQRALFRVFRRSPRVGATARRKDKELSALLEALGALATGTGAESGFCPEARRTVRRLVRP